MHDSKRFRWRGTLFLAAMCTLFLASCRDDRQTTGPGLMPDVPRSGDTVITARLDGKAVTLRLTGLLDLQLPASVLPAGTTVTLTSSRADSGATGSWVLAQALYGGTSRIENVVAIALSDTILPSAPVQAVVTLPPALSANLASGQIPTLFYAVVSLADDGEHHLELTPAFGGTVSNGRLTASIPAVAFFRPPDRSAPMLALLHVGTRVGGANSAAGTVVVEQPEIAASVAATASCAFGNPLGADTLTVTSPFGPRPSLAGQTSNHGGIDLRAASGRTVKTVRTGKVVAVGFQFSNGTGYGNFVTIKNASGGSAIYAHLTSYSVSAGDQVDSGAVIGLSGSSGPLGMTPHLHVTWFPDILKADPAPCLPGHMRRLAVGPEYPDGRVVGPAAPGVFAGMVGDEIALRMVARGLRYAVTGRPVPIVNDGAVLIDEPLTVTVLDAGRATLLADQPAGDGEARHVRLRLMPGIPAAIRIAVGVPRFGVADTVKVQVDTTTALREQYRQFLVGAWQVSVPVNALFCTQTDTYALRANGTGTLLASTRCRGKNGGRDAEEAPVSPLCASLQWKISRRVVATGYEYSYYVEPSCDFGGVSMKLPHSTSVAIPIPNAPPVTIIKIG
jgi:murein DD-endopeptidase MepM/ murein hydrolase activator NlpD